MGLKKPDTYTLSSHCVDRFVERFGLDADESKDAVKRYLGNSSFIRKAKGNRELWVNIDADIVFVIEPEKKLIVTVYPVNKGKTVEIDDDLSAVMRESIVRFRNQRLREFGERTSVYYIELATLTDKLGRTSQPGMMNKTLAEIKNLRSKLNAVIEYHEKVITSTNSELFRLRQNHKEVDIS